MKTKNELKTMLVSIHRKPYPHYKNLKGQYSFEGYILSIDHVQGDPFAAPSKVSIKICNKDHKFSPEFYNKPHKRISLQDYLLRQFYKQIGKASFQAKGSGKSGLLSVSNCGQEVLERTACKMNTATGELLIRMEIGFPANGRSINAYELEQILFNLLPSCIYQSFYYPKLNSKELEALIHLAEDRKYIREQLKEAGLIAFVANGSILPRESGISQRPLKNAVPFVSPASMEVTMDLPYKGSLTGMGIKKGITLIAGGGYHGKSTLLKALELGIYDHVAGDGREFVITDQSAVKVRAEDGRSIRKTDISMFINHLPNHKDTHAFVTADASGSTSQAANIMEAIEAESKALLIDEDTSATNFMIRDELMQQVITREKEPITPFVERIRYLYEKLDISTILVAGSCGAFFEKSDCVIQMDMYKPYDITKKAKETAAAYFSKADSLINPASKTSFPAIPVFERKFQRRYDKKSDHRLKIKTTGTDGFFINKETVDLRYVEQLVDSEQLTALAYMLDYAKTNLMDGEKTLKEVVALLIKLLEKHGVEHFAVGSYLPSGLAVPRKQDIFACFNRYREL